MLPGISIVGLAVVIIVGLAWLWRWVWALERSGEATPLARRRALIGFTILVVFLFLRYVAIWGWP